MIFFLLFFIKWGERTAPVGAKRRQHFERASRHVLSDRRAFVERQQTEDSDEHERRRDPLPGLAEKVTTREKTEEICK